MLLPHVILQKTKGELQQNCLASLFHTESMIGESQCQNDKKACYKSHLKPYGSFMWEKAWHLSSEKLSEAILLHIESVFLFEQ